MSVRNRILLGSLLLAVVVAAIFISLAAAKRNRVAVQTGRVARQETLQARVSASGEIRPKNYVELQAEIAGVVTYVAVKEGDSVRQGDVLLRIDPTQSEADLKAQQAQVDAQNYEASNIKGQISIGEANVERDRAALEAARADWKQAQNDLERAKARFARKQQLHEENLLSEEEYEESKNELAAAEARGTSAQSALRRAETQLNVAQVVLKQAGEQFQAMNSRVTQAQALLHKTRDLLEKTVIRSPLTGVITKLNVEVGERAVPGTLNNPSATLMEIADLSVIEAEIRVDETDIVTVKTGQTAKITVDALPDAPIEGRVTEVGNSAMDSTVSSQSQQQTQQQAKDFKVVVQLMNPPLSLRPGLSATADIVTATLHDVITIPIQALALRTVDVDAQGRYVPPSRASASSVKADNAAGASRKELQGVFIVTPQGKASFRPVETGVAGESEIEVRSGLAPDEVIVIGSYRTLRSLKDGDSIRVDNTRRGDEKSPDER